MKKTVLTTTVQAAVLVGTLLSGAGVAAAAPPFAGPTDIIAPPVSPEPEPCPVRVVTCDLTLPTFEELPTDIANPTVTPDPVDPTGPTDVTNPTVDPDPTDPVDPVDPAGPPATTTSQQQPAGQPENPASGVPTPNRIDTGAGPADPVDWWLVVLPVLALLGLAATGAWLVAQRSERRPS